jgi:hypothetical protein
MRSTVEVNNEFREVTGQLKGDNIVQGFEFESHPFPAWTAQLRSPEMAPPIAWPQMVGQP